jgi:hypothetical protein
MTGREVDGDGGAGLRQKGNWLDTESEANKEYEGSYN